MIEIIKKILQDLGVEAYLVIAAMVGAWLRTKNGTGTWLQKLGEIFTATLISVLTTPAIADLFDVKSTKVIVLIAVLSSYAGLALVELLKEKLFQKVQGL